jgi:para-aminobenzoate synthetase/4-amino-4-deoxychorismate lyase
VRRPEFSLLETLLWKPGEGYWLLTEHLMRLRGSAEYFDIPIDIGAVAAALNCRASDLPQRPHKVRLLVGRAGSINIETTAQDEDELREPIRLELAAQPVDSSDVFLYHKTTRRQVYDSARAGHTEGDDVLLYNERGEVTETCRANVAVRIGQNLWTPPIESGLLAGTYRSRLIAEGKVRERVIPLELLETYDELFSLNSVRGVQRACLVGQRKPRDIKL